VRHAQAADTPSPVVTLDSGYDLETLAHSTVDADLLVRLAKHRVVYRAPNGIQAAAGLACTVSPFGWPMTARMASRNMRLD
jgi:hypothetical protein